MQPNATLDSVHENPTMYATGGPRVDPQLALIINVSRIPLALVPCDSSIHSLRSFAAPPLTKSRAHCKHGWEE